VGGWVGGVGGCLPCAPDLGTQQTVYRVFFARHTANGPFAVCSKICTRQKFGHTANWPFPVVHVLLAIDFIQDVLLIEILDWFIRDPLVLGLSDHINRKHAVSQIISVPQFALRYGQWHSFLSLQVHSQIKISDWLYMFLTGNCPRDVLLLCSLHCQNFCRLFFNAL